MKAGDVGPALRLLIIGGVTSYRALFNWTTPAMYVGTLLAAPLFQLLFFVYLGREIGTGSDEFYIIGNSILAASMAGVFGGTMAVSNERRYGTLGQVLLSPRSQVAVFLGRALPYAANGLVIATFTLLAGSLLLNLRLRPELIAQLLLPASAGALSCSFFGLALGAIGLRLRDVWLISNVAVSLLLLMTGVNVPTDGIPTAMRAVSAALPITHSAEAARRLTSGSDFGSVVPLLTAEIGVALGYAVVAAVLLRWFEIGSRRHATLDVA